MSSISEMATSATTSRLRSRRRELPKPPSPCALRPPAFIDVVEVHACRAQRRREAEQDAGDDRDAEREREDRAVERDGVEPGNVAGIDVADDLQRAVRDEQTGGAAEQAEQQALGQQLPDEPLPARAERGADRDFLLTAGRARQQQVRDVRARDQQHERHRSEQHENRQPHVADDGLDQRARRRS